MRPMEKAILLDASVAVYALGDTEPMRSRCRDFL